MIRKLSYPVYTTLLPFLEKKKIEQINAGTKESMVEETERNMVAVNMYNILVSVIFKTKAGFK